MINAWDLEERLNTYVYVLYNIHPLMIAHSISVFHDLTNLRACYVIYPRNKRDGTKTNPKH